MIKLLRKLDGYIVYRAILWFVFFTSAYILLQYHVALAYPLRERITILVGNETILNISRLIVLIGPITVSSFEKEIGFSNKG